MARIRARHPRVTLVAIRVAPLVPGGVRLRWQGLTAALSHTAYLHHFTVAFDRSSGCAAGCRPGAHEAHGDDDDPYADHFCPTLFDDLVAHVRATRSEVVVLTHIQMHRYARELAATGLCRVVYDMHNAEYLLRREIRAVAPPHWRDHWYPEAACVGVHRAEGAAVAAADQVWTCSPDDRRRVEDCYGLDFAGKLRVVPNVVPRATLTGPLSSLAHVLCTGRFDYYPNAQALEVLATRIAPRLARAFPGLPVVLAGAGLPRPRPTGSNLRFVADPVDVGPLIETGIMTVPLTLGGGTRFKVLEALAAGAPVVSTSKGVEGLGLVDGTHYRRAESTEEFVDAIADVIASPARRRAAVAGSGAALVQHRYSVAALVPTLRRNLTELRDAVASTPG